MIRNKNMEVPPHASEIPRLDHDGQGPYYANGNLAVPQRHPDVGPDKLDLSLEVGSFVMKPAAIRKYGFDNLINLKKSVAHMNNGGPVGSMVPGKLKPNEMVFSAAEVKAIGVDKLTSMNDSVPTDTYVPSQNKQQEKPSMIGNVPKPDMMTHAPVSKVKTTDRYGNTTEVSYDTKAMGEVPSMRDAIPMYDGGPITGSTSTGFANGGPVNYAESGGLWGSLLSGLSNAFTFDDEDQNAGYANYNQQDFVNEAQAPNSAAVNSGYTVGPQGQFNAPAQLPVPSMDEGYGIIPGGPDQPVNRLNPELDSAVGDAGALALAERVAPMSDTAIELGSSSNRVDIAAEALTGLAVAEEERNIPKPKTSTTEYIAGHEGYRDDAYQDQAGVWTIGFGRTTNPDGSSIQPGQKTDSATEQQWLGTRTLSEENAVKAYAAKHGYQWGPDQIKALASFRYNIGNLDQLTAGGTRTDTEIAAKMPEYVKAGGQTSQGLVNRRNDEAALFSGITYDEAGINVPAGTLDVPAINLSGDAGVPEVVDTTRSDLEAEVERTQNDWIPFNQGGPEAALAAYNEANAGVPALDADSTTPDGPQSVREIQAENTRLNLGLNEDGSAIPPLDEFGGPGRDIAPPKPASENPADYNIIDQQNADDVLSDPYAPKAMQLAAQAFNRDRDRNAQRIAATARLEEDRLKIETAKTNGTLTQDMIDTYEFNKAKVEELTIKAESGDAIDEAAVAETYQSGIDEAAAEIKADETRQTYNTQTGEYDLTSSEAVDAGEGVGEDYTPEDLALAITNSTGTNTVSRLPDGRFVYEGQAFNTQNEAKTTRDTVVLAKDLKDKLELSLGNSDVIYPSGDQFVFNGKQFKSRAEALKAQNTFKASGATIMNDAGQSVKLVNGKFVVVGADGKVLNSDLSVETNLEEKDKNFLEQTLSNLGFQKSDIAETLVLYIGSRLLGYNHHDSLNSSVKQTFDKAQGRGAKSEARKKEIRDLVLKYGGDYSAESIEDFYTTGEASTLKPLGVGVPAIGLPTAQSWYVAGIGKIPIHKDTNGKGAYVKYNGQTISFDKFKRTMDELKVRNGKYDTEIHNASDIQTRYKDYADTSIGVINSGLTKDDPKFAEQTIDLGTQAQQIYKDIYEANPSLTSDLIDANVKEGIKAYLDDKSKGKATKSLKAYVRALIIPKEYGVSNPAFIANTGAEELSGYFDQLDGAVSSVVPRGDPEFEITKRKSYKEVETLWKNVLKTPAERSYWTNLAGVDTKTLKPIEGAFKGYDPMIVLGNALIGNYNVGYVTPDTIERANRLKTKYLTSTT